MPRKLPWQTSISLGHKGSASSHPHKRRRLAPSSDNEQSSRIGHFDRQLARTPSTSPPRQAPSQEPMKAADSDWVMVEDELYATAQLFTHHLHFAEYQRLKKVASSKKGHVLDEIKRPTTGFKPSLEKQVGNAQSKGQTKVGKVLRGLSKRQGDQGAKHSESSAEGEEELAIGDRNLAGLMRGIGPGSGRKPRQALAAFTGPLKSNTRAAAGYKKQCSSPSSREIGTPPGYTGITLGQKSSHGQQPEIEDDDDDDDDDLDAGVLKQPKYVPEMPAAALKHEPARQSNPVRGNPVAPSLQGALPDRIPMMPRVSSRVSASEKIRVQPSDDFKPEGPLNQVASTSKFDDWPRPKPGTFLLSQRQAARDKASVKKEKKDIQLDEIPTFLF